MIEGAADDGAALLRVEEAVGDAGVILCIAHEAAAAVGGVDESVVDAALNVDVSADADAAVEGSPAEGDAADAVGDGGHAGRLAHDAGGASVGAAAVACDDEVLDGGTADVAEGCSSVIVGVAAVVDGQGVTPAVEDALEFMAATARPAGDGLLGRADVTV